MDEGRVASAVVVSGSGSASPVKYTTRDDVSAQTVLPCDYREIVEHMRQKKIDIEIRDARTQWSRIVADSMPFLLLLAFWFGMMIQLKKWPEFRSGGV